ncbi:MAG: hypothetical protein F6J93_17400 [Oscillatoria sp. SIO1A7]|nr:hypothetical protein [Oscillatoria sp. SIO1A7]
MLPEAIASDRSLQSPLRQGVTSAATIFVWRSVCLHLTVTGKTCDGKTCHGKNL